MGNKTITHALAENAAQTFVKSSLGKDYTADKNVAKSHKKPSDF